MIFTAVEDDTIMAEFEAETPASTYDLSITTTEWTVEEDNGEEMVEVSFPVSIEDWSTISWDWAWVFNVDNSGGDWVVGYIIRNNGVDVYTADATVNWEPWPTDDETWDPIGVNVDWNMTIAVSNIVWPSTTLAVYDNAVNWTITRTWNWEFNSEAWAWEISGLTSEALLTPSEEDHVYSLTIEDEWNTWTFDIVPDNFDDYVWWWGDDWFEITGPTGISELPGFWYTVNIYPTTITPDSEAQ